jgi:hypothetical protein
MKRYLGAAVAVLVLYLAWDNFLSGMLIGSAMSAIPGMKAEFSRLWETVGDLCAALILAGVYVRVRGVFGVGPAGGAMFGFYAGVLINFPTWLFMTVYAGWPYGATWILTIAAILLTTVAGALMGVVYQALGGTKPA